MKMCDMAYTKAEKKKREPGNYPEKISGPDYPYGLRITLDAEQLQKLGIKSLPKVGKVLTLEARATVVAVRQNQSERGRNERSMEIELRQMGVEGGAGSAKDAMDEALDS